MIVFRLYSIFLSATMHGQCWGAGCVTAAAQRDTVGLSVCGQTKLRRTVALQTTIQPCSSTAVWTYIEVSTYLLRADAVQTSTQVNGHTDDVGCGRFDACPFASWRVTVQQYGHVRILWGTRVTRHGPASTVTRCGRVKAMTAIQCWFWWAKAIWRQLIRWW